MSLKREHCYIFSLLVVKRLSSVGYYFSFFIYFVMRNSLYPHQVRSSGWGGCGGGLVERNKRDIKKLGCSEKLLRCPISKKWNPSGNDDKGGGVHDNHVLKPIRYGQGKEKRWCFIFYSFFTQVGLRWIMPLILPLSYSIQPPSPEQNCTSQLRWGDANFKPLKKIIKPLKGHRTSALAFKTIWHISLAFCHSHTSP